MDSGGNWHRFGLTGSPFLPSPSPAPLLSGPYAVPFAKLREAIDERRVLVVVSGEPGSGRTTLARAAIAASQRSAQAAWLPAGERGGGGPLKWLLARLRDDEGARDGNGAGQRLLECVRSPAVVAAAPLLGLDDAETVATADLAEILHLLGAAAGHVPPLSALLVAEPKLAVEIGKAAAASVPSALRVEVRLPSLTLEGTEAYVAHRLQAAGYQGPPPFDAEAMIRLANLSRGLPLRINRLCEACFAAASPANLPFASGDVVAAFAATLHSRSDGRGRADNADPTRSAGMPARGEEDETERLEHLASRVNDALHRSFRQRVSARQPSPPPPVEATQEPKETAPRSVDRRHPPSRREARGRGPLFALAVGTMIVAAAAAMGWLAMGDLPARLIAPPPAAAPTAGQAAPEESVTVATVPAGAARGEETPAPSPSPAPPPPPARPEGAGDDGHHDAAALLARGRALLATADVAAARAFFRLAAEQDSAAGAMAMAATFDPLALREAGLRGVRGNPGEALAWYRRAAELGEATAEAHRDRLLGYLRAAAAGGDAEARRSLEVQR